MPRKWTLDDIEKLENVFLTPHQAASAAGMDAYAINIAGKLGRKWMGLEVYFSGKKGCTAHINRVEYLNVFKRKEVTNNV